MPRRASLPAYTRHAPSGQARVRLNGKDFYLGPYGSAESRIRYGNLIVQTYGTPAPDPFRPAPDPEHETSAQPGPTVAEIVLSFMRHANGYYRKNGKETSEISCLTLAMRPLVELFGASPASKFGPQALKAVRQKMIDAGWCRKSVNQAVGRIRRVFKRAVEEELVSPTVLEGLKALSPLLRGRTSAQDRKPILPVSDEQIEKTLPFLQPTPADMVRLQRRTGMRPGEICTMQWGELDRSGAIWLYRPASHKLEHHGRSRVIAIGPQGQAILLRREKSAGRSRYVFPGRHGPFTRQAYARAVTRAAERAFSMPVELQKLPRKSTTPEARQLRERASAWRERHCWHPNQIRHTFATELRKVAGLDAVAAALGHSQVETSQIYAELDLRSAQAAVAKIG